MKFGASTSCYYPLETEKALQNIVNLGFERTEIFFNTYSEIKPDFTAKLNAIVKSSGIEVCSIHPFSSFAESHCLFGDYQRRADDIMDMYKYYFDACNVFGAKYVVIHGAMNRLKDKIPYDRYLERFNTLVELGKKQGVVIAQENVNAHFSESPEFLKFMRENLKENFKLVFDIKQAVRAGYEPINFLNEFIDDIVHIHISDHCQNKDCMPPGDGDFDFKKMFLTMDNNEYNGNYMIEIYHDDYDVSTELAKSKTYIESLVI